MKKLLEAIEHAKTAVPEFVEVAPEVSVFKPVSSSEPNQSISNYVECTELGIPIEGDLHLQQPRQLSRGVVQVVEIESPVHIEEVVLRIRNLWGLGRAGARIKNDTHFPVEKITLVCDNLNTHKPASLYKAFGPDEARRIAEKLAFHYTPKHGSWLNMAEIEFSVLSRQCLSRRISDQQTLKREIQAWQNRRNNQRATVKWQEGLYLVRSEADEFAERVTSCGLLIRGKLRCAIAKLPKSNGYAMRRSLRQ